MELWDAYDKDFKKIEGMTLVNRIQVVSKQYPCIFQIRGKCKIFIPNICVFCLYFVREDPFPGKSDSIQTFLKKRPPIDKYDVLIIDGYQDIDLEISKLLDFTSQSSILAKSPVKNA